MKRRMDAVVELETGTLVGERAGSLLHFRGIPYARAERFAPPESPSPLRGKRDASRHGPVCPQSPSRFDTITGAQSPAPQDENCLSLSITTTNTTGPLKPVMVWIHGGAYLIGSGTSPWYGGDALVQQGDVVFVSINYRLGVFGYLQAEGIAPGNLGVLDQIAALRWVQHNIERFGGDPARVTVFGESAGGHSILTLMSTPDTRGLFQRAIVQSAHLGVGFTSKKTAARVARAFLKALDGVDPRSATTAQLLAAQLFAVRTFAGRWELNSTPAFGPIAGTTPLPASADLVRTPAETQPEVALLIGKNREEAQFFSAVSPLSESLANLPFAAKMSVGISAGFTKRIFHLPLLALASAHAQAGGEVYTYDFAWQPKSRAFGACHTLELPFVFGAQAAWEKAPMLGGASWAEVDRLGREMRQAWTNFAHGQSPSHGMQTSWPRHVPGGALGRLFH